MDYGETELDKFTSFDGKELDVHIWEGADPKALLLCFHGGMAHGGDYVNVGTYFKEKGYTSISYDFRGHKQKRVKLNRFDDYVKDASKFIEWAKKKYSGLPVFLVAHSAGCNVITKLLIEQEEKDPSIKGLVFSSPYYGNAIKVPGIMKAMAGLLSALMPNGKLPAEDFTPYLTHDIKIYDRHRDDETKEIRASEPSMRFGAELLKSQKWISQNIVKLDENMLVFVAGDDKLSDVEVSQTLLNQLDESKVTQILYENNYHENFNEINRDEIFAKMDSWMTESL
ncbi:MAG: alpha/beta fold hydrolase [Candidatus Kariarchaeaceae archaeon]|jgi:alpha-beta hydrolase superfamily lysophospholipase